jgi:glutaminyl-peptide cyclotransferase
MRRTSLISALIAFCVGAVCNAHASAVAPFIEWRVRASLPHDVQHYTQGFALHEGLLIESTGLYGRSALHVKELRSGRTLRSVSMPYSWFGEGATVWRGRIVMLTWRERIAQWFDLDLRPLHRFEYSGEGWGITHDDRQLIVSDGSARLAFRNADTFAIERSVTVRDGARAIAQLNELEYARGLVFANVWQTDRIAAIDPLDGTVRGWLDLAALRLRFAKPPQWNPVEHVLNGIAYDAKTDLFYVTGKCWPVLFELEVAPVEAPTKR